MLLGDALLLARGTDAAADLAVEVRWVSTKYTPPHVRLGRRLVWTQESIDNWLEQKFEAAAAAREDVIPDGQLVLEVDSPRKAKRTAGGADARMAV